MECDKYFFDILKNHSEKGRNVVEKLHSITDEYILEMLDECHWDPMTFVNSEHYSLVDRSGDEIKFEISIEIPKENRICFYVENLSTCECDYNLNKYEVDRWFRTALLGGIYETNFIKTPFLTEHTEPVKVNVIVNDTQRQPRRMYYRYAITVNGRFKYVYVMGYTFGQGGDPWNLIMDRNDLKDLVHECNKILPYTNYLVSRVTELVMSRVFGHTFHAKKIATISDLFDLVIDELDDAISIQNESLIEFLNK